MEKYYLRQVEVEAMQITDEVFTTPHPSDLHFPGLIYNPVTRTVRKKVGRAMGMVGSWIVRDKDGWISFWNPDSFERTYEKVEPPDAQ